MQYGRPIIDSHFHVFSWFDQQGKEFWENTDAYLAGRDFRAVNYCALPSMGNRDVSNNILVALYKLRHPEVYIHGGLIYDSYPVADVLPEGMDPVTQYRELMAIGFDGIKMLETKPTSLKCSGKPVCDDLYREFFNTIERDGTHMIWHVNDPDSFWDISRIRPDHLKKGWYYGGGGFPSYEEIYEQAFAVMERNPHLNVTFAHFFFMSGQPERLEREVFAKYPNAAVDLTPGTEMYGAFGERRDYYRDYFTRYADRLVFGTDSSERIPEENRFYIPDTVYRFLTCDEDIDAWDYKFRGLALDDEAVDKILCGNFLRRVGGAPRPIDREALKAYILKYRHLIKDERVLARVDEEAAKL